MSQVRTQVLPVDLDTLTLEHTGVVLSPFDNDNDDDALLSWLPAPQRPLFSSPGRPLERPPLSHRPARMPMYAGLQQAGVPVSEAEGAEAEALRPRDRQHEAAFDYLNMPRRHDVAQRPVLDAPTLQQGMIFSTLVRLLLDAALPADGDAAWHAAAPGRAERLAIMLAAMPMLVSLRVGRRGAEPRLREGLLRAVASGLPSWPELHELSVDVLDSDAVALRRLLAEGALCRALGGLSKLGVLRLRASRTGARWPERPEASHARSPDVPPNLVTAIGTLGVLHTLDLSGLELGGGPLEQLAHVLPQLPHLRRVSLTLRLRPGTQDAAALQMLADGLRRCPRLISARLCIINLPGGAGRAQGAIDAPTFAALVALAQAVPSGTEQPLQLAHPCWLQPAQAGQVGDWLGTWPHTEVLNLAPWRPHGAAAAAALAAHLGRAAAAAARGVALRELVLPASIVDGATLGAFAPAAAALPGLETLALGCLTLEPELAAVAREPHDPAQTPAARAADDFVAGLMQLVAAAPGLRALDLSRTRLTDDQLLRLNDALVALEPRGQPLALHLSPRFCYRLGRVRPHEAAAWTLKPVSLGLGGAHLAPYAPRQRPLRGRFG